jgi:hypothetical protein
MKVRPRNRSRRASFRDLPNLGIGGVVPGRIFTMRID